MRISCVGDSLTAGDALHSYLPKSPNVPVPPNVRRCSIADASCRGNYPLDLGDLLGARYHVRNFGRVAFPLCDRALPAACLERSSAPPTPNAAAPSTLPIALGSNATADPLCIAALRQQPLLREALAFDPHIVVVMMGTNDATGGTWGRCGSLGVERSLLLILHAIATASPTRPPVTLLLPPPPLLGEYNAGSSKATKCTDMSVTTTTPPECSVCAHTPNRPECFRHDAIRHVRTIVSRVAHRLGASLAAAAPTNAPPASPAAEQSASLFISNRKDAHSPWQNGSTCTNAPGELQYVPLRLPPMSALFSGPVHLNAIGSALIACSVFEHLAMRCGGGHHSACAARDEHRWDAPPPSPSPPPPDAAAAAARSAASAEGEASDARYELYCRPLQRAYARTLSTAELVAVRAQLDVAANKTISNHIFRGAPPADPP